MTTPIFLLSLPRSGSTLLQRLLATSPRVATTSEPWLLLPQFLGYSDGPVFAAYQQRHLHRAFQEFLERVEGGAEAHREAVRAFALHLYGRACGPGQTHFLDKTPRYHLIARQVLETFPDSPVILLWRHPLAVAASLMKTWCRGRWNLYHYRVDLYHGVVSLLDAQERFREGLTVVRYEDLVADPEARMAEIFARVGLPAETDATRRFGQVELAGGMGDPTLERNADETVRVADASWPGAFATPLRRRWARRYLSWLGDRRLAAMGYDLDATLRDLSSHPLSWRHAVSDVARMTYGVYAVRREAALFRRKRALAARSVGIDVASE